MVDAPRDHKRLTRAETLVESLLNIIAFSLVLGGLDILIALPNRPTFFESASNVAAAGVATAIFSLVLLSVVSVLAVCLSALGRSVSLPVVIAANTFGALTLFLATAADVRIGQGLLSDSLRWLSLLLVAALAALLVYYFLVQRGPRASLILSTRLYLGSVLAVFSSCLVLWISIYRFDLNSPVVVLLLVVPVTISFLFSFLLPQTGRRITWAASMCIVLIGSPLLALPALKAGAVLPPSAATPSESSGQVKRVVLVTIDSLRRDALGCYGGSPSNTPHMDALAADGILFRNAYSAAPWTAPSLASILTGLSPFAHGFPEESPLADEFDVMAERMANLGYATCAVWKNTIIPKRTGLSQGFQTRYSFPQWVEWQDDSRTLGAKILKRTLWKGPYTTEGTTDELTDIACDWIRSNYTNDFFLWLHYYDPHWPFTPPDQHIQANDLVSKYGKEFRAYNSAMKGFDVIEPDKRRWVKLLYEAEVRYVDENIGRLTACLKGLGILDDTLIILTNDHGEEFWEDGNFGHGSSLYNELISSPLILRYPPLLTPGEVDDYVSNGSIMPTILELCGTPLEPGSVSYPSLVPLLMDTQQGVFDGSVLSSNLTRFDNLESIIVDGHKYIHSLTGHSDYIFDLVEDPDEEEPLESGSSTIREFYEQRLQEHHAAAEALRLRYGLEKDIEVEEMTDERRKELEAVGYL